MSPPPPSRSPNKSKRTVNGDCKWNFQVLVNRTLHKHETIGVTGDCEALGNWQPQDLVVMTADNEKENIYNVELDLPSDRQIRYRYVICSVDPDTEFILIRQWETHLEPRVLRLGITDTSKMDILGEINDVEQLDRGWLTTESIVQFKFFKNPFMLKDRVRNKRFYIKITPINMRTTESAGPVADDSISNDTRDNTSDQLAHAFVEVATLNREHCLFETQEQFGRIYEPDDYLIFNCTVSELENVAYIVDLYTHRSKASDDEPPYHIGYHYILPNILKKSDGKLELPITCATRHRPLGIMRVDFLKITPFSYVPCDFSRSYARYWNNKWTGLDVGHRGSGTSFKANDGNVIRENTIASLKKAAAHGADMVEFDVQLSKDLVPVIYHDFYVYVSLKRKLGDDASMGYGMLELPLKELTLNNLRELKVYHSAEGKTREQKFFDEHLEEHQPFPELAHALEVIDSHVGFNVEIKWGQEMEDGTHESTEVTTDRNLYLDRILEVVLSKAGARKIVFSCFDPDICTMLRYKQNLYPVMFLTCGVTKKWNRYREPRCSTIEYAVKNASCMELLGIVAHTEDLLRDSSQINMAKDKGLTIFCWGDDNNCKDTIKHLKNLGLHGVIYDKMDVLSTKGAKENVFLVGANEAQSSILKQIEIETDTLSSGPSFNDKGMDQMINFDPSKQTFVFANGATSAE